MAEDKQFTLEELKAGSSKKDLLMLIHGKVYAIAKFLDEHPGGDEVLLSEAGKDATEAFEDVGHSDEAREILDKYYVGLGPEGMGKLQTSKSGSKADVINGAKEGGSYTYLYPLAGLVAWFAYKYYAANIAPKA